MKRPILATILIGILVVSGCKAAKEETVASVAGFVSEAETQGAEELKKEPEILPSEQPKEEEKEPSQEQEQPIETDPPAPQVPRKLTVEDVISLSEKGEALSYKDFEVFIGTEKRYEHGKNVYIVREYIIDEQFFLSVGFYQNDERTIKVILVANDPLETRALDVRAGGAEAFFAEHSKVSPLTLIEFEWEYQIENRPFEQFYAYAEKYGEVKYDDYGRVRGGFVQIDTLEDYQAFAGEAAESKYDAAFFEEKSLILFNDGYAFVGDDYLIVGRQDGKLYFSGIVLSYGNYGTIGLSRYELNKVALPKDQLKDDPEIVFCIQHLYHIADPENYEDWVEPEPEYPPKLEELTEAVQE
ncbi:MAG: hypothetical protein IJN82_02210 [Clostridia bacterium]|nr:hypothetical protein [Clostridia bacterium]